MARKSVIPPLSLDLTGLVSSKTGLQAIDFAWQAPRLEVARGKILADAASDPRAGFLDLPDRLLAEYRARRHRSEVGRIMKMAARLAERVDRVVLLAAGGSSLGVRAILDACCHPFHNELSRGERGGHPRLHFAGQDFDNDRSHGLLDLLMTGRPARDLAERWAIIAVSPSGCKLETAAALRQFLAALRESCGSDTARVAELFLPITGTSGSLRELSQTIGCPEIYDLPDNLDSRFSILSVVGLLPATLLGLDIVKLLEGAAEMNARFRKQSAEGVGEAGNLALQYAAASYLLEARRGAHVRLLATWHPGLEAAGRWCEQLVNQSLVEHPRAAMPMTVVLPRDQAARAKVHEPQSPQENRWANNLWVTNLIVDQVKRDRLAVGVAAANADRLDGMADKTLTDLTAAAISGQRQADVLSGCPAIDVHLPRLDEASLGQWFQMLMLATAVEGRLAGVDPYRAAGVPGYKQSLSGLLKSNDELQVNRESSSTEGNGNGNG